MTSSLYCTADLIASPLTNSEHCHQANGSHFNWLGRVGSHLRATTMMRIVWVANFQDRAGNDYSLKVTDPDVTRRLENGETISKRSLLTVSMTKPWTPNPQEKPPLCYKVVAAVIELP